MSKKELTDDQIKANLPWYVNETLSDQERQQFEQLMRDDMELKQEAELLSRLRNHIKQQTIVTPGEMGLQRLKNQIKQESNIDRNGKWRNFALAASVILMLQIGVIVNLMNTDTEGDRFKPLSGIKSMTPVIQLQFKANATEQDIRNLLLSINASIVDGPSKNGIYRLKINTPGLTSVDKQIGILQSQTAIVDFAATE